MKRLGGIAVASAICGWGLAPGVPSVDAARLARLPTARVAATLARIIRRDVRQQIRRHKTAVTVTTRCCGGRVLRVHYRAKGTGDIKQDVYVLSLETKRGILRGVAISESSTEAGYKQETGRWEANRQREFAIAHASHGSNHGWSFSDWYSDTWHVEHGLGGGPSGLGLGRGCRLPTSVPSPLYKEALLMLERAKRHVPSAPSQLPSVDCGPIQGSTASLSSKR